MNSFKDREEGFERQFAHDADLRFRAEARRDKLLGLWAAAKLGKSGADAEAYARTVIVADLAAPGDEDVFTKIRADLAAAGVQETDAVIRTHMLDFLAKAVADIKAGT